MASSVNLFNTGKSGLFASRQALSTTGHNIANVNTEGYSRQRVDQATNEPVSLGNVNLGTGTKVANVRRINDDYLNKQITGEMKNLGEFQEKDVALTQAESIFNEIDNDGMNRLLSKFFNEYRKLANEPESEALRATLKEAAVQLTADFHRMNRDLQDVQRNVDRRIEGAVTEANALIRQIADLNQEIKRAELKGGEAPDLRDRRDLAVRKLGTDLDISLATNEKGEFTVSLAGIGPLVSGNQFNRLYVERAKANLETGSPEGALNVLLENLAPPKVTERISGGKMGGLIEARDKILGRAQGRLDELAYALSTQINALHRTGYSASGATGNDFFAPLAAQRGAAELIRVGDAIDKEPSKIATGLEAGSPGDNRLIQRISSLQHGKNMDGGNATYDDFYNATVTELATASQRNRHVLEHQGNIVTQLEKIRESISGVSLDEETTNLVQYQHAFDAAAKIIKVADELLETVLRMRA